jgi:hypothetical protein
MGTHSLGRFAASIVLFFLVAAGVALAFRHDRATAPARTPAAAIESDGPREIWRCHACATLEGKNWATCKTVTGRGTEKAARDLVSQRVCNDAGDSAARCNITQLKCRKLPPDAVGARPAPRGDPPEPE